MEDKIFLTDVSWNDYYMDNALNNSVDMTIIFDNEETKRKIILAMESQSQIGFQFEEEFLTQFENQKLEDEKKNLEKRLKEINKKLKG